MNIVNSAMTEPENSHPGTPPGPPRGQGTVLLLALFFVLPVLLVLGMHKFGWHPQGSSHGHMLVPPAPVHLPANISDSQQRPLTSALFKDKWSMVYVAEECGSKCVQQLNLMRRLQVSMDKDMGRLQRVLIAKQADWASLQKTYPDLIGIPTTDATTQINKVFLSASSGSESNIYLVDPLGNLMMYFPEDLPPTDIRKDLARLLAYAWAG